jgi:hypothetical protein
MRAAWFAVALCSPLVARADVPAEATALFDQGMKDLRAGNTELACKELSASLAKYTDSGTKGALATCYGKLGKVVSAWSLWKDLADTASPADRADAAKRAKALEPRLPRFVVKLQGVTRGLVVTINGNALADPTLAVPLPVDPGPLAIIAHAPDHRDWTQTLQATEGATTTIEIPALDELPKSAPIVTPPIAIVEHGDPRHKRHVLALAVGAVGGVGLIAGAVFGLSASSNFDKAKTDCGGNLDACAPGGLALAQADVSSARSSATLSTIGFGVGGALVTAGAVLWFTAPSAEESRTALRLVPSLEPRSAGLVLSGRW